MGVHGAAIAFCRLYCFSAAACETLLVAKFSIHTLWCCEYMHRRAYKAPHVYNIDSSLDAHIKAGALMYVS